MLLPVLRALGLDPGQRWVAEAQAVLDRTRALLDDPTVKASPALAAELQRFLRSEEVGLRFERVRVLKDQRHWRELLGRWWWAEALASLAAHIGRRLLASRRRARSAIRVRELPTDLVLVRS